MRCICRMQKRGFGFFGSIANGWRYLDDMSTAEMHKPYLPTLPLEGHKPLVIKDRKIELKASILQNGIRVVTEKSRFPAHVNMGLLLDVSPRDETDETSGCCQVWKGCMLKTLKNTNETTNYSTIQMSGGDFTMDFDQEHMYYKACCMEYDVKSLFRMMVDCALEERSPMAFQVGKTKAEKLHALNAEKYKAAPQERANALFLSTAYGNATLGMPLEGYQSSISNLSLQDLNDFFQAQALPSRMVFCANGIEHHEEFLQLVEEYTRHIPPAHKFNKPRTPAQYLGGETRTFYESPLTSVTLGFESVPWTHEDMPVFSVLSILFGNATGFSMGGPGKGMHCRAVRKIFHQHSFIESVTTINNHFTDSGVFGIQISGAKQEAQSLGKILVEELHSLSNNISEEELQRAKNILKINILMVLERQGDRLEELVKNYTTFSGFTVEKYLEVVEQVTLSRVHGVVSKMIKKSKGTLVTIGGNTSAVDSLDKIMKDLNSK